MILMQRYLTFYFDTLSLNYFRLSAGAITLLTASLILYPNQVDQALRRPVLMRNLVFLALIGCVAQWLLIEGLAHTSATLIGLLRIIGIILGIVLAYVFFHDERATVHGKRFKAGAFLTVTGTLGVVLAEDQATLEYSLGTLYAVCGIFVGSSGTVLQKNIVNSMAPIPAAAIVTAIMSVVYAGVSSFYGEVERVATVPWYTVVILFGSGMFGLFVGVGLGFITVRIFGVITHRLSRLIVPFLVGILSYCILGETLTIIQMICGAILVFGCYLVVREQGGGQVNIGFVQERKKENKKE